MRNEFHVYYLLLNNVSIKFVSENKLLIKAVKLTSKDKSEIRDLVSKWNGNLVVEYIDGGFDNISSIKSSLENEAKRSNIFQNIEKYFSKAIISEVLLNKNR